MVRTLAPLMEEEESSTEDEISYDNHIPVCYSAREEYAVPMVEDSEETEGVDSDETDEEGDVPLAQRPMEETGTQSEEEEEGYRTPIVGGWGGSSTHAATGSPEPEAKPATPTTPPAEGSDEEGNGVSPRSLFPYEQESEEEEGWPTLPELTDELKLLKSIEAVKAG